MVSLADLRQIERWPWIARRALRRLRPVRKVRVPEERPRHRRYLSDAPERTEAYLQAAREYVSRRSDLSWLYRKPYDRNAGHPMFFEEMYAVMNLLQAMAITTWGKVLEVGSGPGWITEILLALGYEVDAVEPSEEMIAIAQDRIAQARRHLRLGEVPRCRFHAEPLESCALPGGSYDAALFHASLHHLIDEDRGLAQCFRLLRPGGVLGISEAAWVPGNRQLESDLEEEMRQFGTLESPYTAEYLDFLLHQHGFVDIQRYYTVNGLFPAEMGDRRITEIATGRPLDHNVLTARKPSPYAATTLDPSVRTEAGIEVLDSAFDRSAGTIHLRMRLINQGETVWLAEAPRVGFVTIALRRGELESPGCVEAEPRHRLPYDVKPGEELVLSLSFRLPADAVDGPWVLDLVDEGQFWFSRRGSPPAVVQWE
jgi:SAM-dependent methyltransferase